MCTVVILRRPGHDWPLLLAANRDEMADRPWLPPARHWADRIEVVAGIDQLAGGTWLGLNDHGVVACILNRRNSLGPDPRLRSRGELVLEALDHADADDAARALGGLDGRSYRSFNMVIADNRDAFWIRSLGEADDGRVSAHAIPDGLSMLTARELDDPQSPRIRLYRPRFAAAPAPDPAREDWSGWQRLLACRDALDGEGPGEAMTIETDHGFGTLSSSLIALPSIERVGATPIWRFAAGRPDRTPYLPVAIGENRPAARAP
ncbi:MAG: NRDE family protein [Alphaproteobacteria bacterium]|nr:NRDE family protein [Alphaproteobacteria bacterium]